MQKKRAVFNWSGGKDSAHALWKAIGSGEYEIIALLTTVNKETRLSTMHDIPIALLQEQSRSIGIPLFAVDLKPKGNMLDYNAAMNKAVEIFKGQGVTHFIFGDIFLHDVRSYREKQLAPEGIEVAEPLWGMTGEEVMDSYLSAGFKTVIVTTMDNGLGKAAIGKILDKDFVDRLPADCDLNGENGEYHTFCFDGPVFSYPVPYVLGEPRSRSYDIRLNDGTVQTFTYWFAALDTPAGNEKGLHR